MELSGELFPVDQRGFLDILARVGLVLFMFVVGLELDVSLVKGRGKVAASVSVCSIVLPFSLGIGLAKIFVETEATAGLKPDGVDFWPFALFMGAAMSITAFPVLARILTDRRMHRTETGGLALACAATDDIIAWTLLAVVLAISGVDGGHGHLPVVGDLPGDPVRPRRDLRRPAGAQLAARRRTRRPGELTPTILSVVLVGMLLFAATTEVIGIHYIFGAFLFGAIIPHENAAALRHEILIRLEQISVLLLLPVFFLLSGLKVNIQGLGSEHILPMFAILAVAIIGKYVGAYVGAKLQKVPHWQASSLGLLMNTRGLTELIILNVGLEKGLLEPRAVHADGDHGARDHGHDRAAARVHLSPAPGRPRHRRGRAGGARRRGGRPDPGAEPSRCRQRGAARARRHHARRRPAGRDRHRRPPAAGPAARPGQRTVRRARRDGGRHGEPAGAGAPRRGARRPGPGDRPPHRRRRGGPRRAGRRCSPRRASWPGPTTRRSTPCSPWSTARPPSSPTGTAPFPTGAPVSVAWSADSNGDAAVVLGARLAVARQVALQLPADGGRRLGTIRTALEERGVRVTEPATPDPDSGLTAAVIDVAAYGASPAAVDRRQERAGRRTRRLRRGRARRDRRGQRGVAELAVSCCCPRAC